MNQYSNTIDEMRELFHEFVESSITVVQLQRLDYLIKNDVEARVEYVELMNMHNTLESYLANVTISSNFLDDGNALESVDLENIVNLDREALPQPKEESKTPQTAMLFNILESIPGYFSQNTLQIMVLLLLLLPSMIALFSVFCSTNQELLLTPDSVAVRQEEHVLPSKLLGVVQENDATIYNETFNAPEKVARMIRSVSADWGEALNDQFKTDPYLLRGQKYTLLSGFVELQFRHDARVVVRSPATFVPTSHGVLQLDSGQCVAHVPPKAAGFMIESNGSQIIDLGTEFGVNAEPNMETNVYVFKGKVEMAIKGQPPEKRVTLLATESAQASADAGAVVAMEVAPDQFVRHLDLPGVITKLPMEKADFNLWIKERVLGNVGITDDDETCTFTLRSGIQRNTSEWIFRSLDQIQPSDLGHTLRFSVTCKRKTPNVQPNAKLTVAFSNTVSRASCGTFIGTPGSVTGSEIKQDSQPLTATLLVTNEMVGRKLFLVLHVEDDAPGSGKDQYEFSNLKVEY